MNLSIRVTLGLLAMTGLITGLGFFGWLSIKTIKHENDDLLKERLTVAYTAAYDLDNTLKSIHALLDTAVDFESGLPSDKQFAVAERLIREAFAGYGIRPMDIAVVDATGRVVLDIPEEPEMLGGVGYQAEVYPAVKEALNKRSYTVSEVVFDPLTGMPAVLLVSPIFQEDGLVAGAIIAEISIKQLHLFFLSSSMEPGLHPNLDGRSGSLGNTGYVELIDGNGVIIDRTSPGPPVEKYEINDYSARIVKLIGEKKAAILNYSAPEKGLQEEYVLAFAPLSIMPWGVIIWQAESEVLDASSQLTRQMALYGIIFLLATLILIWVGMQRLLKPILLLTSASKKIGEGNFDISLPIKRRDEIGKLTEAFQTMTAQLSQARDTLSNLYQSEKEKEELRGRLLQAVVAAQEDERKRLARELHDELAQTMTAMIMKLESLENHPPARQADLKNSMAEARELAARMLDSMRDLTFALRPLDLDVLGLVPAVRRFIEHRERESNLNFHFEARLPAERFSSPLETELFRISQELIRNVEKHASAVNVYITLEKIDHRVQLVVKDDGKGFAGSGDTAGAANLKSFGLIGIRERAVLMGGELKIESEPGKGTRVTVTIPLPVA